MAIWDDAIEKASAKIYVSADTHKCPNCATNLFFDSVTNKLKCSSCGESFYPEYFEIKELLSKTFIPVEVEETEYTQCEIMCNSCGATVIADKDTTSTFCTFCGSPALVINRLTNRYEPKSIIPFKVQRDEALQIFKDWASKQKYFPKDFMVNAKLELLSPVYVPFWLIDADCYLNFIDFPRDEKNTIHEAMGFARLFTYKMKRVPFDGSEGINDFLMERIGPFNYEELVPFSSGYLLGYVAKRYDENIDNLSDRIVARFRRYLIEQRKDWAYNKSEKILSKKNYFYNCNNFNAEYALMPIWFLNYKYDGEIYQIAINGQTGKIDGNLPFNADAQMRKIRRKIVFKCLMTFFLWVTIPSLIKIAIMFAHDGIDWINLAVMNFVSICIFLYCFFAKLKIFNLNTSWFEYINISTSEVVEDFSVPPGKTYIDKKTVEEDSSGIAAQFMPDK